jgi:HSP20 family protein
MSTLVKSNNGFPEMISRLWDAEKTLFSDFFGLDGSISKWNRPEVPSVNVIEEDKQFLIEMAAPGKQRDDFKVEVEDGYLKISCEKEEEKEENKPNFRRKEFSYDFFISSAVHFCCPTIACLTSSVQNMSMGFCN